jgi:prolyl-tRNA synthetase
VVRGVKTQNERFAGAVETRCIEALMQDGKALQSGTSHDLGQNFGRAFNVTFQNEKGEREHVWQTSWGLSTRMIGALIMAHSDDGGLVLPPRLAPIHVAVVPIYKQDAERTAVLEAAARITGELREDGLAVELDARDGMKPGAKYFEWERKGVPVRIELGPRDLEQQAVMIKRRVAESDASGKPVKEKLAMRDLGVSLGRVLDEFQDALFQAAQKRLEESTTFVDSWKEFLEVFRDGESRFVYAHWDGTTATELAIKEETKVTIRCLPYREDAPERVFERGACVKTGKPSAQRVLFAKNY